MENHINYRLLTFPSSRWNTYAVEIEDGDVKRFYKVKDFIRMFPKEGEKLIKKNPTIVMGPEYE